MQQNENWGIDNRDICSPMIQDVVITYRNFKYFPIKMGYSFWQVPFYFPPGLPTLLMLLPILFPLLLVGVLL